MATIVLRRQRRIRGTSIEKSVIDADSNTGVAMFGIRPLISSAEASAMRMPRRLGMRTRRLPTRR
jgi:hypothetical protein